METLKENKVQIDLDNAGCAIPRNGVATYIVVITRSEDDENIIPNPENDLAALQQVHDELQDACDIAGLGTWFKVMGRVRDGAYITTGEAHERADA